MGGKIKIAEAEPCRLPQTRHALHAAETVALDAPSAVDAELASESVEDGVDVGRNVQPPPVNVVAGVDDDGQIFWSDLVMQALNQFCATRAACENDDHLCGPRIAVIVRGSQQASGE